MRVAVLPRLTALVFIESRIQRDAARFRCCHNLVGRLAVVHHMAVLLGIADAEAPFGHEVSGESGRCSEHAHGGLSDLRHPRTVAVGALEEQYLKLRAIERLRSWISVQHCLDRM